MVNTMPGQIDASFADAENVSGLVDAFFLEDAKVENLEELGAGFLFYAFDGGAGEVAFPILVKLAGEFALFGDI